MLRRRGGTWLCADPRCSRCSTWFPGRAGSGRAGQVGGWARWCEGVAEEEGPAASQGQFLGRYSVMRRADEAILARMLISFRRMVTVVARARPVPAVTAVVRVRLKAITARTSQAALGRIHRRACGPGRCSSGRNSRARWRHGRGGFFLGDRALRAGGEERVEAVQVEERGLAGEFVLVQFRDAAHDEAAADVVRLLP